MLDFSTIKDIYKPILIKEIIGPIITIFLSVIIYSLTKKVSYKIFHKNTNSKYIDSRKLKTIELLINNISKCIIIVIDIVIILEIFGVKTSGLLASLGIASAVLGLAFQDILKDIITGISIIVENQYAVGDTVTINDFKGEVIFLGVKTTKIKSYTGEVLIIPNHNISEVINHSLAKSLAIVKVQVAYEEKTEKVEEVLNNLCARLSKELPNINGEVKLLGISDLGSSGIEYQISVETKPMKHFEIARIIRREVKMELDKNHIVIPYNQVVIHNARL